MMVLYFLSDVGHVKNCAYFEFEEVILNEAAPSY